MVASAFPTVLGPYVAHLPPAVVAVDLVFAEVSPFQRPGGGRGGGRTRGGSGGGGGGR